jgi:AraC-like DNA-binding protein
MELSNDYLTLKLRRLRSPEQMDLNGRGLFFVISKGGEGACHCGSLLHRLASGDVLVVDSASQGKIHVRNNGEMVFWFFIAEFEHLFPLFSGREICLLQKVAESFDAGRVYPGSSPLAKECLRLIEEVPVPFSLGHRSHVLRIVSAILTVEFKAVQPKLADFGPMRDHVLQVFERLGTNEFLSLAVGDLARKFNCSRRHLNRLFHQHLGVSVAALRMEMRLLKAVSLLVDPDAKIVHVAEKCGFNHLGLFNACFKKRFGNTPSQWRKRASSGENLVSDLDVGHPSCPMHTTGLCPWTPKLDDRAAPTRKTDSMQELIRSNGPANPKLRETIIRSLREARAQIPHKPNSGINLQDCR